MRTLDVDTQAALRNRGSLVPRNFIKVVSKDRATGVDRPIYLWDDAETVSVTVLSGETGALVSYTFVGDGAVLSVDQVPMRLGLEVRTIEITLSSLHSEVQKMVRTYDPRFGKFELYRGLLDPVSGLLVSNPRIRFLGQVNGAPIDTGSEGRVSLRIVSHTRELTRVSSMKRSDETQKLRNNDRFRRYTGTAGEWPIWWGEKAEKTKKTTTTTPAKKS